MKNHLNVAECYQVRRPAVSAPKSRLLNSIDALGVAVLLQENNEEVVEAALLRIFKGVLTYDEQLERVRSILAEQGI